MNNINKIFDYDHKLYSEEYTRNVGTLGILQVGIIRFSSDYNKNKYTCLLTIVYKEDGMEGKRLSYHIPKGLNKEEDGDDLEKEERKLVKEGLKTFARMLSFSDMNAASTYADIDEVIIQMDEKGDY